MKQAQGTVREKGIFRGFEGLSSPRRCRHDELLIRPQRGKLQARMPKECKHLRYLGQRCSEQSGKEYSESRCRAKGSVLRGLGVHASTPGGRDYRGVQAPERVESQRHPQASLLRGRDVGRSWTTWDISIRIFRLIGTRINERPDVTGWNGGRGCFAEAGPAGSLLKGQF